MAEELTQQDIERKGRAAVGELLGPTAAEKAGYGPAKFKELYEEEKKAKLAERQAETELEKTRRGELVQERARGEAEMRGIQERMGKEFAPTPATQGELVTLFGMLGAVGGLMGRGGYTRAIGAMNAMGGMLKGYNQGRKDLFDREKEIFDRNQKALKEQLDFAAKAFERNMKYINEGVSSVQQKAMSELKSKGYDMLAATLAREGGEKYTQLLNSAQTQLENRTKAGIDLWDKMQKTFGAATGLGATAELTRIYGPAATANLSDKEAKDIYGKLSSVKQTMNLIEKAKDPDIKFGEIDRLKTRIEAALRRNLGDNYASNTTTPLSSSAVGATLDQAAVEAGLNPNDKNVVFYKEAVFTALEMERAARGGSILPVAVMKTLTPLLDPKTTTREAYIEILRRRANEIAAGSGLNTEQFAIGLRKMPSFELKTPGAAPVEIKTLDELKAAIQQKRVTREQAEEIYKRLKAE